MPPIRSISMVKPVKTERTHEENQERAYIAASRRSDRSLEARVESARRASEIHKRRTGRSLRVTERDVINEEMYEEEDDDLPMQYRRLTAHLQTSNAEFDRRLAAYLTNHVAMRTALGQAVAGNRLYPNSAQFANQGTASTMPHNANMGPPHGTRSPTIARPFPYPQHSPTITRPSPYPQHSPSGGMKQAMHNRASSFATPNDLHSFTSGSGQAIWNPNAESRRTSSLSTATTTSDPRIKRSPTSITELKFEAAREQEAQESQQQAKSKPPLKLSDFPAPFHMSSNPFSSSSNPFSSSSNPFSSSSDPFSSGMGSMPFSTTLPPESQQLLGGALDASDPMTAMLFGSDYRPDSAFYDYGNADDADKTNFGQASTFSGMHQTLAPGFHDTAINDLTSSDYSFAEETAGTTPGGSFRMSFSNQDNSAMLGGNGELTPSTDKDWQSLINGNAWDEQSSQQTAS